MIDTLKQVSLLDRERIIVSRISDRKAAIGLLGLSDAVIEKFGDEITLHEYLDYAKAAVYGPFMPDSFSKEIEQQIQEAAKETAIHWLTLCDRTNHQSLIDHTTPEVSRFGRRMYLELNPENLSSSELERMKTDWNLN